MAVAWPPGAQIGESFVYFRRGNRAALHIDESMDGALIITDNIILGVDGDAVSILVGFRRRDNLLQGRRFDSPDSAQRLFHLFCFSRELVLVGDMLVTASPTPPEVWAGRDNAMRGSFQDLFEFGFRKLLLFPCDSGENAFAFDRERNEDHFAFGATDSFAAEGYIFDLKFQSSSTSTS